MTQKKKTTTSHLPAPSMLMGTGTITADMSDALHHIKHLSGPPEKVKEQLDNAVACLFTSALLQLENRQNPKSTLK